MEEAINVLRERLHQLENEKATLLSILDMIPGYVCLIARDHTITYTNKLYRQIFGNTSGKKCYDAIPGRNEPCIVCPTFQVLKTKQTLDWVWKNRKGEDYIIYDSCLFDDASMICEIGLNISHLRKTEKAHREPSESCLRVLDSGLEM